MAHDAVQILATVQGNQGYGLWELGLYRQSLDAYRRQAELFQRLGASWGAAFGESSARFSIASVAARLCAEGQMEPSEVERLAREAVATAVACGDRGNEANGRLLLAQRLPGAPATAEIERALAVARGSGDRRAIRFAQRILARQRVLAHPPLSEEAYRLLAEAADDARASNDLEDTARAMLMRAWMRFRTGPREQWLAESDEALDAIERIRALQAEESIRTLAFGPWTFAYYRFSGSLLDGLDTSPDADGDLDLALRTIERMRARVLLDALDRAGVALRPAPADPASFAGVDTLRQRLAPDQALLSYQLAPSTPDAEDASENGGPWVVVVTRARAKAVRLPPRATVEDRVAMFLGLCRRRDGTEARAAAVLYRDLLAGALAEAGGGIRRLVVVPDGCLNRLPFGALRDGEGGTPLAASVEISVAPSATLWLRWKSAENVQSGPRATLALADPDLGATAPAEQRAAPSKLGGQALGSLRRARAEAHALISATAHSGSVLLSGRDASESALKHADLRAVGIIHLAAHAIVNDAHPQRSAILLAPGAGDDGLLQVREIVALPLAGKVVVLTACRSASGAEIEGEGVLGLARGFHQAGAAAVMGTWWPVRDEDMAAFTRAFASHLGRGESLSAALRAAAGSAIRAGAPVDAWAGAVLIGNGDLVVVPRSSSAPRGHSAGLVVLLVALSLLAVVRRARSRRRAAYTASPLTNEPRER